MDSASITNQPTAKIYRGCNIYHEATEFRPDEIIHLVINGGGNCGETRVTMNDNQNYTRYNGI